MTDKYLDEARQKLAEIRAHLEGAQSTLELSSAVADPTHAEAKAKALKGLQAALDSAEVLGGELGGVPAPVRH